MKQMPDQFDRSFRRVTATLAAAPLLCVAMASAQSAELTPLGHLAGGDENFSQATSVSDDGRFVGGHATGAQPGFTPILWDGAAMNLLQVPSGFIGGVFVNDISGDGQSVVGMGMSDAGFRGVRWDPLGDSHVFSQTAPGTHTSFNAINYDGTVAGGFVNQDFFPSMTADAAIWTADGGIQNVGGLPGATYSSFSDVTNDGSTFVGFSGSAQLRQPVMWDSQNGFQTLGGVPDGTGAGIAIAVAPYGDTIVGSLERAEGDHPTFWDADGNANLINLWDGYTVGEATGVTTDGGIIVGNWRETPFSTEPESLAFIWDHDNGARPLQDVLVEDYGVDLMGWTLNHVADITPDGMTFVGTGLNPDGDLEAFKVTILPAPGVLPLVGLAMIAGRHRRRYSN